MLNIEDVKKELGNLAELFKITRDTTKIVVQPLKYIPPNQFKEAFEILKGLGSKYTPKDKGGPYFIILDEEVVSTATTTKQDALKKDLWAYVDSVENHADSIKKQAEIIKEKLRMLGYKGN